MKTNNEKELLETLVKVTRALGRMIDQTQHSDHDHPELEVLEMAFDMLHKNSDINLFETIHETPPMQKAFSVQAFGQALNNAGFSGYSNL